MSTDTIEQRIEKLAAQVESYEEKIEELKKPRMKSRRTRDSEGGSFTYWEEDGEQEFVWEAPNDVSRQEFLSPRFKKRSTRTIEGYKGADAGGSKFKSAGDFYRAGLKASGDSEVAEFASRHKESFKIKSIEGMSTQVAEDGGYLVYPEFSAQILERVYSNDIFGRTDNYSVTGNQMNFPRNAETSRKTGSRHGGMQAYWVGEGNDIPDSKPKIRQVSCKLKKLAVVVYLTEELMEDSGTAIETYVNRKAAEEFNFMLGDAVFNGNGVGQPLGITQSGSFLAITKESGQAANSILAENIDKMWMRRIAPLVNSPGAYQWYHNQDCSAQLDNLAQDVGTGGLPLYRQNNQIAQDAPQTLKGVRRQVTEFQETLGTMGDIVLADLGQVLSISKGGISQEASIHVKFLSDQVALKFTMRVDCRPWEDTPTTPYKGNTTQSCFVGLETRA